MVCGLASPHLTGRFPCRSPLLLSLFRWDRWAGVIIPDRCFWAFTTIELWTSITFIVLSLLDLWAPIYRLCYLVFRTFGLCRTLNFRSYRYWAFRSCGIVLTFILWYGNYYYYFGCIILLLFYFRVYIISRKLGVTFLVSELFIYPNILLCKSGCHNFWYQSQVPSRLRPGMAILETWFYSVLMVLDDFKIFSWIWEFWKWK